MRVRRIQWNLSEQSRSQRGKLRLGKPRRCFAEVHPRPETAEHMPPLNTDIFTIPRDFGFGSSLLTLLTELPPFSRHYYIFYFVKHDCQSSGIYDTRFTRPIFYLHVILFRDNKIIEELNWILNEQCFREQDTSMIVYISCFILRTNKFIYSRLSLVSVDL